MSLHLVVTRCSLGAYCSSSHFPDYFILLRGIFGTALGHRELIAKVTPVLARATASLCGLCWLHPLHLSVHLKEPGSGCPVPCSLLGAKDAKVDGRQHSD